ncbi:transcription initiation factor TFIID subunit 4B isoform C [Patagioenas fasciata monilis]|uniref:Transcription initiation factor TFIID subunit 4B isoform C n=1 Tax=Patagioenas fasciata monilis TaxID=372326 RepID=A0A1V4KFZ2_PATFA|nr:transcription initiation factor TFIID subunit 4B isoform C [Patagioenas fasciata monilis]
MKYIQAFIRLITADMLSFQSTCMGGSEIPSEVEWPQEEKNLSLRNEPTPFFLKSKKSGQRAFPCILLLLPSIAAGHRWNGSSHVSWSLSILCWLSHLETVILALAASLEFWAVCSGMVSMLPANFQLPPGTVLIRSSNGQLMLVSQQATARTQSQLQNNTNVTPSVPTSTPTIRICAVQNSGTQLLKKVTSTPVKSLSQTTNAVASTLQAPAVIQPAAATASVTTVTAVKPSSTETPVKLPVTGPPAQAVSQKAVSVKAEGTTVAQTSTSTEMLENVKKCKNFLATLIKLASSGPQAPQMGQNVKNLVQNLLEAKIEPEEFTKKLYIELKSSPQPYLVPFLKKSMLALRQLMPNAQSFIQQCMQQPAPTQDTVSTCTSAALAPSVPVATTSLPVIKPVSASVTVTASPVIKPVLVSVSTTTAVQTVKPVPASAVVTASLRPAASVLTTTTSGLTAVQTVKPVLTSVVAKSSLQSAKPVLVSTAVSSATTPLQSLKPVAGTPISIKISQPNSIVAQSVGAQQVVKVKQLVVQQPSGTIVKQVSTLPQPSTLTLQTSAEKRIPLNTLVQTNQFSAGSILKQITLPGNTILSLQASSVQNAKIKENGTTSFSRDEDDINDVTSMAGVNLNEENACILATNSELIGTVIHSCADEPFLSSEALKKKILNIGKRHDIMELNSDVVNLISHATQERLRGLLEKLTVIAQHRLSTHKGDDRYIVSSDTRAQLRFLEKLDHLEKQRKDEEEREMLLRAAKSRSNKEDPEQLRLKQKAKEMQQLELAQMQQREANLTALAAIGPRKKRPLDSSNVGSGLEGLNGNGTAPGSSGFGLTKQLLCPRITRVCLRDLIFCMEQEREMKHSLTLYRALLK